jgi:hypothetical protein
MVCEVCDPFIQVKQSAVRGIEGIRDRIESQLLDFETAMKNEIDSISNSIDNKVDC